MGTDDVERAVREGPFLFTAQGILSMLGNPQTEPTSMVRALRDMMRWTAHDRLSLLIRAAALCAGWASPLSGPRPQYATAHILFRHVTGDALKVSIYVMLMKSVIGVSRDIHYNYVPEPVGSVPETIKARWREFVTDFCRPLLAHASEKTLAFTDFKLDAIRKSVRLYLAQEEEANPWHMWSRIGISEFDMATFLDSPHGDLGAFWDAMVTSVTTERRERATHWQYSMKRLPDVLSHKVASYIDDTLPPHEAVTNEPDAKRPRRVPMGVSASFYNPHLPGDNVVDVVVPVGGAVDAAFKSWMAANPEYIAVPGDERKRVELDPVDSDGYALVGKAQKYIELEDKAPSASSASSKLGAKGRFDSVNRLSEANLQKTQARIRKLTLDPDSDEELEQIPDPQTRAYMEKVTADYHKARDAASAVREQAAALPARKKQLDRDMIVAQQVKGREERERQIDIIQAEQQQVRDTAARLVRETATADRLIAIRKQQLQKAQGALRVVLAHQEVE